MCGLAGYGIWTLVFRLDREKDLELVRQAALLLESENKRLLERNVALTREVLELKGLGGDALQLRLAQLEEQLAQRNQALFGKSSEKRPGSNEAPSAKERPPKTGHGPREQKNLPVIPVQYDLDVADQKCPVCGGELKEWVGQFEESEEIDVIERRFVVKKHQRKKYRCGCNACIETALGPVKLFPGAHYSIDFAIEAAVQKYADHLPLERQVKIFEREGLVVDSQTLWDQTNALANVLSPLHDKLRLQVLSAGVIGADETRWELLRAAKGQKDGEAGRWFDWTVCSHEAVFHQILETRSAEDAEKVLGNYEGTVVADGYGAYRKLQRKGAKFRLAACWTHVRRGYLEAEPKFPAAAEVIELIGGLYQVERDAPGVDDRALAERLRLRKERSRPKLAKILAWALASRRRVLPSSSLGEAIAYMLKLWPALKLFLEDARVPLDNNWAERGLRGLVVGRKNHYGSRSRRGTEVASQFYTLIETCKLVGVEPKAYLRSAAISKLRDGTDFILPHQLAAQGRPAATAPAVT